METKATIQIGDLTLQLEGSEGFVAAQMDRFSDVLLRLLSEGPGQRAPEVNRNGDSQLQDKNDKSEPGKTKKTKSTAGAGQGCAQRMKALVSDGFFSVGRTTTSVSEKRKEQATPYAKNRISASLIALARGKALRRYQDGGEWMYINP